MVDDIFAIAIIFCYLVMVLGFVLVMADSILESGKRCEMLRQEIEETKQRIRKASEPT